MYTMSKSKLSNILTRMFITLLGIGFIIWGVSTLMLGVFGDKGTAVITSIRREGGERNELVRGRYTYNIGYTFILPNGKRMDGNTKKIRDAIYLKADGKSRRAVRYFSFLPHINALEEDTKPGLGQLIFVGIGCFLMYVMNRRNYNLIE